MTRRSTEQIVRLGVAHVPEGRGTFAPLTVEENLRLGAYARRDKALRDSMARASSSSRGWRSAATSAPARSAAASSRCWRSPAR